MAAALMHQRILVQNSKAVQEKSGTTKQNGPHQAARIGIFFVVTAAAAL
jgi:hypothetical protein